MIWPSKSFECELGPVTIYRSPLPNNRTEDAIKSKIY